MVMKRTLPYHYIWIYLMNFSRYTGFIQTNNLTKSQIRICTHFNNCMNMIWHNHIVSKNYIWKILWNDFQFIQSYITKCVKFSWFSKNTRLIMGTNGDKIIILATIIKVLYSR